MLPSVSLYLNNLYVAINREKISGTSLVLLKILDIPLFLPCMFPSSFPAFWTKVSPDHSSLCRQIAFNCSRHTLISGSENSSDWRTTGKWLIVVVSFVNLSWLQTHWRCDELGTDVYFLSMLCVTVFKSSFPQPRTVCSARADVV